MSTSRSNYFGATQIVLDSVFRGPYILFVGRRGPNLRREPGAFEMNMTTPASTTIENVTVDLGAFTVALDGQVVYTVPQGWAPFAQITGELADMADDGRITRAVCRALINAIHKSYEYSTPADRLA